MDGVAKGLIVRMSGYLDGFNVTFFYKHIMRVIECGYVFLSFDLEKINYISSRGIGTFTTFLKALKAHGGDIHLFGLRPKVQDVFSLLGFQDYFNIGLTVEDAIARFKGLSAPAASDFPLRAKCPVCGQTLMVPGAGKGRCPKCKCVLSIDQRGRISRPA